LRVLSATRSNDAFQADSGLGVDANGWLNQGRDQGCGGLVPADDLASKCDAVARRGPRRIRSADIDASKAGSISDDFLPARRYTPENPDNPVEFSR
jgi:hypothetical protein